MTKDDYPAIHAIYSDEETMRFLPYPPHTTLQQTADRMQEDAAREGAHLWSIQEKISGDRIGLVTFLGETRFPGMGYVIRRDRWGQGLTAEACEPVIDYGFSQLGYDRIELWIDERNTRSQGLARKLGFTPKGRIHQKYAHRKAPHFMLIFGRLAADSGGAPETRFFRADPVLAVPDILRTTAFYREVLGFHVDFLYGDPPNHAGVSRGEWSGNTVRIQFSLASRVANSSPAAYLQLFVDEHLDALYAHYRDQGVEVLAEPEDKPWGLREFAIRDCNGFVLVFARFR